MKIESIRKEKEAAAEAILRTQFKMEMIVYTQDGRYSKKLGKRKRDEEQNSVWPGNRSNKVSVSGATLKEMTKHLKSYYQVNVIYRLLVLVLCYTLVSKS